MPTHTKKNTAPPSVSEAVGASGRELVYVGFGLVCFLMVLVVASGSTFLVVRDFWLDEICTYLLATDPSLSHMFDALLHGADSNLPALYLILRGIHAIGVPINEITLRLFSATAGVLGLTGLYACLRLVFDRLSSALAVASLFCGTLLIGQFFEARFYAPWFAVCTWFCYCLALMRLKERARGVQIVLALLTVLMLSIHYFGVFSFAVIVAADFLADRQPIRARVVRRWPLLFALPMIAVIAFFYMPQKRALTVPTWISDPTPSIVGNFLAYTLALEPLAALAVIVLAGWFVRRFWAKSFRSGSAALRPLAGLAALAAVPLIEVVFSYGVQPATIARYGLPGLGSAAVLMAWLYHRLNPKIAVAVAVGFAACSGYGSYSVAKEQFGMHSEIVYYALHLEKAPANELILFELRHDLYPMTLYFDELEGRLFMLDFEASEESPGSLAPSDRFAIVERDANRAVARSYPRIHLFPRSKLAPGQTFLLVAANTDQQRLEKRFSGAKVSHISIRLFEITLPP